MSEKIMDGIMEEAAMDEETMDVVIMNEAYPDQGGGQGGDSGSGPGTGTALLEKEQVEERTRKDDTGGRSSPCAGRSGFPSGTRRITPSALNARGSTPRWGQGKAASNPAL